MGSKMGWSSVQVIQDIMDEIVAEGKVAAGYQYRALSSVLIPPQIHELLRRLGISVTADVTRELARTYAADGADVDMAWEAFDEREEEEERREREREREGHKSSYKNSSSGWTSDDDYDMYGERGRRSTRSGEEPGTKTSYSTTAAENKGGREGSRDRGRDRGGAGSKAEGKGGGDWTESPSPSPHRSNTRTSTRTRAKVLTVRTVADRLCGMDTRRLLADIQSGIGFKSIQGLLGGYSSGGTHDHTHGLGGTHDHTHGLGGTHDHTHGLGGTGNYPADSMPHSHSHNSEGKPVNPVLTGGKGGEERKLNPSELKHSESHKSSEWHLEESHPTTEQSMLMTYRRLKSRPPQLLPAFLSLSVLLKARRNLLNIRDLEGRTALFIASALGNQELSRSLLANGQRPFIPA